MITLKTDYKDAVLDLEQNTKRKFSETTNSDGTVSLTDVSVYSQQGDTFGQNDINNTNKAIKEVRDVKVVTLSASGWSSSAPYTQTIAVDGITSADHPIISMYLTGSPTSANVKAMVKAFGMLDRAVTGDGNITFYCYNKKPTANFNVLCKGV